MSIRILVSRCEHINYSLLSQKSTVNVIISFIFCFLPLFSFQGPEHSAFLINVHEPVIWRLHEMIKQVDLSRIYGSATSAVSVDPIIQIGYAKAVSS